MFSIKFNFKIGVFSFFFVFNTFNIFSQTKELSTEVKSLENVKMGAYYFDGWTGAYPYHITQELVKSFPEREPKWGWITSSQAIMNEQIEIANNSGLSFFSFCWYYSGKTSFKSLPLNRSLEFYLISPNINKLKYTLLVANHTNFEIGPLDWEVVCEEWIRQFKLNSYLTIDHKPIITFFSLNSLVEKFETTQNVKKALNHLRQKSMEAGLKGVSIAVCLRPDKKDVKLAEACGFDILTGYNYHSAGFVRDKINTPIESMQKGEIDVWNQFLIVSKLPYIPVTTINWDPRPWASDVNNYSTSPYFSGFSNNSVYNSVLACKKWIQKNTKNTVKEKIGMIYAWNEYGEGAYLTPTKSDNNLLDGVSKALKK